MTLRSEMHAALDDVVPSATPQGLSDRVLRTAVADGHRRHRKERWSYRMRAPLSLVGAFLLVAVVAGILVGGNLIRGSRIHTANPASQRTLAELEALPLSLPIVKAGDACPDNPGANPLGYDYGGGPVYVNGKLIPEVKFEQQDGTGGGLYHLTYYSRPDLKGLFLVRGQDLVKGRAIMFIAPQGPGFPADTPPWPLKDELVLDAAHPPIRDATTGYGIWHVGEVINAGWSGCWGLQIDGSNFEQRITGYIQPY